MNIILLSGGSGKRLWPLSNDIRSKQFIKIFKTADGYESMVQRVYRQITEVDKDASVTIATSKTQVSAIHNQLGDSVGVCVEPCRRDAFPFTDWGELWGIADRTNYDLSRHQEASGKSLEYFDPETNEHYIPYVIEPSLGCDRVALAFLCEAYDEQHLTDSKGKEDVRTVLHLHPFLAPFKCAVLPLSKKLGDKAMEIRNELAKDFMVDYDDAGSIGKRYRRQDEIGTPLCITVDFQTVGDDKVEADGCVTVRDRDTMEQVRMPISELKDYIAKKVAF